MPLRAGRCETETLKKLKVCLDGTPGKTPTKQERRPAHCQRDTRAIADSDEGRPSDIHVSLRPSKTRHDDTDLLFHGAQGI